LGHSFPCARCRPEPRRIGPFRPFLRTMTTGGKARFGPFSVSLRPFSLTQPNHARFGTDVRSSQSQWVKGRPKECGFEGRPLRRNELGSNDSVRYVPRMDARGSTARFGLAHMRGGRSKRRRLAMAMPTLMAAAALEPNDRSAW